MLKYFIAKSLLRPRESIMENILTKLEEVLKLEKEYIDENGKVIRDKVQSDALNLNTNLLQILINDDYLYKYFFVDVNGVKVFDKVKFSWVLSNREFLPNSFTRFKNRIGLIDSNGSFISSKNDVVINFPHKDCFLEGGQTKEDQKRKEVLLNETLNKNDIDVLLEPKVITNYKIYHSSNNNLLSNSKAQEKPQNFLIKGNNLVALYSLLPMYKGKIKLIYIDPPFNTGNDGFGYNDSFTHSTWLTFMKNRLEVAKQLLSEDGSIFVQCDENENAYLRILMDEIFGRENLMNEIIWRYRTYIGQVKEYFPKKHDTIFWYKKNFRPQFNLIYEENLEETVDYKRWEKYIVDGNKIKYGNHPSTDSRFTAYLNRFIKQNGVPKVGEVIYEVRGYVIDDVWDDIIALDPKNISERTKFTGGQKPEALLQRIISSVTREGDIVLDYHLGSGTTAAVAHKMNRRYIGIEQMDYFDSITIPRMINVLNGDMGGISKSENWTGGGSFATFELKKLNYTLLDDIQNATDKSIDMIFDMVIKSPFLIYKVKIGDIIQNKTTFNELDLVDKKRFLIEILDKNMLYVNYSEIDDENMKVTPEEKINTKKFYGDC